MCLVRDDCIVWQSVLSVAAVNQGSPPLIFEWSFFSPLCRGIEANYNSQGVGT